MNNTRFLASVAGPAEAMIAARHGVDVIDLKNPLRGVLGAVSPVVIREIVAQQRRRDPERRQLISATVGDLPLQPQAVATAIRMTADTGVDIVKIGWFAGPGDCDNRDILPALRDATEQGVQLVVVLFAEHGIQIRTLADFAEAGVHGVMLDTADKTSGTLRDKLTDQELAEFLSIARRHHLACGLAGSLRRTDIQPLLALKPDYLGFRGALCRHTERTAGLDDKALESVRLLIKSEGTERAHAS